MACLIFGVVDWACEPSNATVLFAASQGPFAVGAVLLALSAYPDSINKSRWAEARLGGVGQPCLEEAEARGVLGVDTDL